MYLYWLIPVAMKHAKKVLASDSMGKVDFANRLLNSVLNLPVFGGIHVKERTT